MYNRLLLICKMLRRTRSADYHLGELLLSQYQYGCFNYDYKRELINYYNRMNYRYSLGLEPLQR